MIVDYKEVSEFLDKIKPTGRRNGKFLWLAIKYAVEKQIPYKPKEYEDKYYGCRCGNVLLSKWEKYPTMLMPKSNGLPYCLNCGQKLDWSDCD